LAELINFIRPVFQTVGYRAEVKDLLHLKFNPMYKEYEEAIRIGKLILKKESYNIKSDVNTTVLSPPFWIDMSKLFELYVFQKLKERFKGRNEVRYHQAVNYLEPDYILKTNDGAYKMVVDAKYKPRYEYNRIHKDDIRQVAGYARLEKVYDKYLKIPQTELVDCLIIYSNQGSKEDFMDVDFTSVENKEQEYVRFFKTGIRMPVKK
jgi:5-methylcytosine-specific restriction enzyme subunit McrC